MATSAKANASKAKAKTKITVDLSGVKPSEAWSKISTAIDLAYQGEQSTANKEIKLIQSSQAELSAKELQFDMVGQALNGPPIGVQKPTVYQIFKGLRALLQVKFPTDFNRDPFANPDTAPVYTAPTGTPTFDLQQIAALNIKTQEEFIWGFRGTVNEAFADEAWSVYNTQKFTYNEPGVTPVKSVTKVYNQLTYDFLVANPTIKTAADTAFNSAITTLETVWDKNFNIQEAFKNLLEAPIKTALDAFGKGSISQNADLAEAEIVYIQQLVVQAIQKWMVVDQVNPVNNQSIGIKYAFPMGAPDPQAVPAQTGGNLWTTEYKATPAPGQKYEDVLTPDVVKSLSIQYVDYLEGPNPYFPPPGGQSFLFNLEKMLLNQLMTEPSLQPYRDTIYNSIRDTLYNDLVNLGVQGGLLTDAYDRMVVTGIKGTLLNTIASFKGINDQLSQIKASSLSVANDILSSQASVTDYLTSWESVVNTLNADQTLSLGQGSDTVTENTLLTDLGEGSGNNPKTSAYISALIGSPQAPGFLEEIENLNTVIAGQTAGLGYMGQTLLAGGPAAQNQASGLEGAVTDQFNTTMQNLGTQFTNYTNALNEYLTVKETEENEESLLFAALSVEQIMDEAEKHNSQSLTYNDPDS